jgi:hypothetical protein
MNDNPVDWAQTGIIGGLVLLIIWTGVKKVWLFKWVHDEIVAGKDRELALKDEHIRLTATEAAEWKRTAFKGVGTLEQAVDRTTKIVETAVPLPPVDLDERLRRIDEELQGIRRGGA